MKINDIVHSAIEENKMDENLVEVTGGNDLDAFLFCAAIVKKEKPDLKPHLSHLLISGNYVYSTSGSTARMAQVDEAYNDGVYRIFKKEKNDVVLYLTEITYFPQVADAFRINGLEPVAQVVSIPEDQYFAQAIVIESINGAAVYNAEFLKNASGVYDVYMKDRCCLLYNPQFAIFMAPIQKQDNLPGM